MKDDLAPLDHDVLAVLRNAKPLDAPEDARARIFTALEARIASLPIGEGPGGEGTGTDGTAARTASVSLWVASHPLLAVSTAFVVGGVVALLARGSLPERVVYVDREVAPPAAHASARVDTPTPMPTDRGPVLRAIPVESLPTAAAPSPEASTAPTASGPALAAESAILDVARTALARGEADHALAAVDRHAAKFPNGLLREEREALAVKALVLAGLGDEARARAARFRQSYPASLFLTAIDSSLKSIP